MKKLSLFILALAVVCKGLYAAEPRITNGFDIGIYRAPWQVFLKIDNEFWCGGSIIAPNMILTARHCLYINNDRNRLHPASAIRVVAGVTCRSQANSSNTFAVSRIIPHPDRNVDAAILVLSRNITFDNYRQPVNFLASNIGLFSEVGNTVRASGWGWTNSDELNPKIPDCLQAVYLTIISNEEACNMLRPWHGYRWNLGNLGTHQIAARGWGVDRQGICHNDSGGPLTAHNIANEPVLVGIAQAVVNECVGDNTNSPSVFVRVSHIRNWILSHIVSNMFVSGPNLLCANALSTFSVSNVPRGASISWTRSPGLSIVGSAAGSSVQVRAVNTWETSLNEWVEVRVAHGTNTFFTRRISVTAWVSGSQRAEVRYATLRELMLTEFRVTTPCGLAMMPGGNFRWSTDLWGFVLWQGYPIAHLSSSWGEPKPLCGSFYVMVTFMDVCGGESTLWRNFYAGDCWRFTVYPNPARDVLTVTANDAYGELQIGGQRASLGNVELRLYNHDGQLVRRQAMGVAAQQAAINISGLPAGNYVLNIVVDGEMIERQVIVVVN